MSLRAGLLGRPCASSVRSDFTLVVIVLAACLPARPGAASARRDRQGHVGLTPQAISSLGGFRPTGKTAAAALGVVEEARISREVRDRMLQSYRKELRLALSAYDLQAFQRMVI